MLQNYPTYSTCMIAMLKCFLHTNLHNVEIFLADPVCPNSLKTLILFPTIGTYMNMGPLLVTYMLTLAMSTMSCIPT